MPRSRTTPEPLNVIHYDTLDFLAVEIKYTNAMQVAPSATKILYGYSHRDASGEAIYSDRVEIPWGDAPKKVKAALKTVYNEALTHAESKGHVGPGTDSGDIGE